MPTLDGKTVYVRRFSDARIQKAVEDALAHVSAEKPVAVVAHVSAEGVKLSAAVKLGEHWSIMAAGYKDWRGDLAGEAKVVWTP